MDETDENVNVSQMRQEINTAKHILQMQLIVDL